MEKLMYVVWKRDEVAVEDFRAELLGPTAQTLIMHGARGLAVTLSDERARAGATISRMERPMTGTVAIWVDTALNRAPIEAALARVSARLAGYLALESVPIVNTTHVAPLGERTPGLYTVAFLERPDFLTYEAWLERWQGHHTRVAIETQRTFLYIQNVLVRALTPEAPPWTAIVEEAFPAEAATDPMQFYAADTPAELAEQQRRMFESCRTFIDFSQLESRPFSAYVLKTPWG